MIGAPDTLLSELCAICHTNPLKYKCPRCSVQTCSLACVKRHKLWSQCSGVRNPAAYRKRNELATPASVDQDYNFITSVERSLDRADNDAAERGIPLDTPDGKRMLVKGQKRTNMEIASSGAIVLKAPEGMSRNRQNKTRWNAKHKALNWTIEWILPDGSKSLANASASTTVGEAFMHTIGGKVLRKRKRGEGDALPVQSRRDEEPQTASETKSEEEHRKSPSPKQERPGHSLVSGLHFYLHSPNTPSAIKSLIPADPGATIAATVKERLLLEFPTIFLLYEAPEMLSKPFVLEADYAKQYSDHVTSMLSTGEEAETAEKQDHVHSQIDERSLLESLHKDLVS